MKNITPGNQPRSPWLRRNLPWVITLVVAVLACVLFPRILVFVEMAARQLRYLWWLVLILAIGGYFFFFFGKKKE